MNLGKIPTFKLGGFPEDGWFRASKGEFFGQFDDGTSYIANNNQIVDGVAAGVEEAAYRGMMRALSESGGVTIHVEGDSSGMYKVWKEEYKSEGFSAYLSKPVRMTDLIDMVERFIPKDLIVIAEKGKE